MKTKLEENSQIEKTINDLDKLPEDSMSQKLFKVSKLIKQSFLLSAAEGVKKEQDKQDTYFAIVLKLPEVDKIYQLGCYTEENLARKVYSIVFEALENEPDIKKVGWFDLRINTYRGTIVKCPAGLRLKEPGPAITMVEKELTFDGLKKLSVMVPIILENAAILRKAKKDQEDISEMETIFPK